jgi:hypothetical protein
MSDYEAKISLAIILNKVCYKILIKEKYRLSNKYNMCVIWFDSRCGLTWINNS